jgi:hypothetical protein
MERGKESKGREIRKEESKDGSVRNIRVRKK